MKIKNMLTGNVAEKFIGTIGKSLSEYQDTMAEMEVDTVHQIVQDVEDRMHKLEYKVEIYSDGALYDTMSLLCLKGETVEIPAEVKNMDGFLFDSGNKNNVITDVVTENGVTVLKVHLLPLSIIDVAPVGQHGDWNYELDDENQRILLRKFISSRGTGSSMVDNNTIHVYDAYNVNGKLYQTYLATSGPLCSAQKCCRYIVIHDHVNSSMITDMHQFLYAQKFLEEIKFGASFDTSNVTTMANAFDGVSDYMSSLDLTSFDTRNVDSMYWMFHNCSMLWTVAVSRGKWVVKSGCDTSYMFYGCRADSVTYV